MFKKVMDVVGPIFVAALFTWLLLVSIHYTIWHFSSKDSIGQFNSIANQVESAKGAVVHISNLERCQGSGCLISEDGKPFQAASLADLNTVRVGDPIFVMGSPFGYENFNSVTLGIISSMQRDLDANSDFKCGWSVTFQSDAGVCPGNSGGPVFNIDGQVIGVVVAGYSGAEVNYSVPVSVFIDNVNTVRTWFELSRFKATEREKPTAYDGFGYKNSGLEFNR